MRIPKAVVRNGFHVFTEGKTANTSSAKGVAADIFHAVGHCIFIKIVSIRLYERSASLGKKHAVLDVKIGVILVNIKLADTAVQRQRQAQSAVRGIGVVRNYAARIAVINGRNSHVRSEVHPFKIRIIKGVARNILQTVGENQLPVPTVVFARKRVCSHRLESLLKAELIHDAVKRVRPDIAQCRGKINGEAAARGEAQPRDILNALGDNDAAHRVKTGKVTLTHSVDSDDRNAVYLRRQGHSLLLLIINGTAVNFSVLHAAFLVHHLTGKGKRGRCRKRFARQDGVRGKKQKRCQ